MSSAATHLELDEEEEGATAKSRHAPTPRCNHHLSSWLLLVIMAGTIVVAVLYYRGVFKETLPPRLTLSEPLVYITGKFGAAARFRRQVFEHCKYAPIWLRPSDHLLCLDELPSYVLEDERFRRHFRFLDEPHDVSARGGGYWAWKSLILNHTLHAVPEGRVVIYSDNDKDDVYFFAEAEALSGFVATPNATLAIEQTRYVEHLWAKEDALLALNATPAMRNSGQYNAQFFAVRNTPAMRRFLGRWVELVQDWHLVSDEPSIRLNADGFQENRHDQALLSLLVKTHAIPLHEISGPHYGKPPRTIKLMHVD